MKTNYAFRALQSLLLLLAVSSAFAAEPIAPAPDDPSCTADDRRFMERAFELARVSYLRGDMGIGAVLVKDGKIICEYGNSVYSDSDLTLHCETGLISRASRVLPKSAWVGATLYTSLEPCIMCCGTIHWAGIKTVVYGGTTRLPTGQLWGLERLRIREIYERNGWTDMTVRGPLMDSEQLKIRAEIAAYRAAKAKS